MNDPTSTNSETSIPEIEQVSRIFRALAYPKRLEILMGLMAEGSLEFAKLLEIIDLGKTALANHLAELEKIHLISKPRRGLYEITERGTRFLKVNTSLYEEVKTEEEPAEMVNKYGYKNPFEVPEGAKIELGVSAPAKFVQHPNSFAGCLAGILQSLGHDADAVDVCGVTGLAFLVRYQKAYLSSGCRYTPDIWGAIMEATEDLGYKIAYELDANPYPSYFDTITLEDLARAQHFFRAVKAALREYERPVILWGGKIPEYYIVNGVYQNSYMLHGFHPTKPVGDYPLRFDAISSPRYMHLCYLTEPSPVPEEERDRRAITRAVAFADGADFANDQYISGPAALKQWAAHLEHYNEEPELVNPKGNNYLGEYYMFQFRAAAEFLERIIEKYPRKTRNHYLREAAEIYRKMEKQMFKFNTLFPYDFAEDAEINEPETGAAILVSVSQDMAEGIKAMKNAEVMW